MRGVHRDARRLEVASTSSSGSSMSASRPVASMSRVRCRAPRRDRGPPANAGSHPRPPPRRPHPRRRGAKAVAGRLFHPKLALEVAQRQIIEVEAPLAGTHEVRGECGVAGETRQRPAASAQRMASPASPRAAPWAGWHPQASRECRLVLRRRRRGRDVGPLAVGRRDRDGGHVTAVGSVVPTTESPCRSPWTHVRRSTPRPRPAREPVR